MCLPGFGNVCPVPPQRQLRQNGVKNEVRQESASGAVREMSSAARGAEWGVRCRQVTRENRSCPLQAGVKLPEPGTGAERGTWEGMGIAAWNRPVRCLRSLNEKPAPGVFFKKQQKV